MECSSCIEVHKLRMTTHFLYEFLFFWLFLRVERFISRMLVVFNKLFQLHVLGYLTTETSRSVGNFLCRLLIKGPGCNAMTR